MNGLSTGPRAPAGMEPLYEARVEIRRTVPTSGAQAWALADKVRRLIVRLIYRKAMTTAEIVDALSEEGIVKSYGTIRHHMSILLNAGVIGITEVVAVRGTVEKRYEAATKVLEYDAPEDFDKAYAADISAAARRLGQAVGKLAPKVANRIPDAEADPGHEQFVIAEILNRATTRVLEARYGGGRRPAARPAAAKESAAKGAAAKIPSGPGKGRKPGEPRKAAKPKQGAAPRAGRPKAGADKAES